MREIRNDDILQIGAGGTKHLRRLKIKTAWEWFLEADKVFEEYNYPCTLTVLSKGIEYWPEWVKHIKKHQHRYKIELHGLSHRYYNYLTAEEGFKNLHQAKNKIEKEFNVKITTWYVPYGKRKFPVWGKKVCDKLGIELDTRKGKKEQYKFHYWYKEQVEKAHNIIKNYE